MNKLIKIFTNGLITENPLLILVIGLCSSLAVTTGVANGIGMGLSTTFVLVMSEIVICLLKKLIPDSVRIPIFIIIIAAFCTVIDYLLQAYFPELSRAMGVFIQLIAVNCIIMARVEGFASKRPLVESIADGLGMGLGYTWVLVAISLIREILGNGSILGFDVLGDHFTPILFFALPPGGFLVFALFVSIGMFLKTRLAANQINHDKKR